MFALLNPRVIACLVVAGALAFSHLTAYRKGKANVRTEWLAATALANQEAQRMERARQANADEAARAAATRANRILADSASARRESLGLRDDLRSANDYARQSRAAAERVASLATDLLGRCEASYLGVAEAAARADSEARQLRDGWPK